MLRYLLADGPRARGLEAWSSGVRVGGGKQRGRGWTEAALDNYMDNEDLLDIYSRLPLVVLVHNSTCVIGPRMRSWRPFCGGVAVNVECSRVWRYLSMSSFEIQGRGVACGGITSRSKWNRTRNEDLEALWRGELPVSDLSKKRIGL